MTGSFKRLFAAAISFFIFSHPAYANDPIQQAAKFFKEKKYDKAAEVYSKVIKTYPNTDWELTSRFMTAKIHEAKGDTENAIEAYKHIVSKHKKSAYAEESYFSVAKLRSASNDNINAVKAYEAYLKAYPAGTFAPIAYFNAANINREAKDYAKALEYYSKILSLYPNDFFFYSWSAIYSGHIHFIKKEYETAADFYRRVINSDRNRFLHTLSSLYLGEALMEKKDYASAEIVFQNILKTTRQFSEEALYGLARAQFESSKYDMAKETLETIAQLYPQSVWMKEVKDKLKVTEAKLREAKNKDAKEL